MFLLSILVLAAGSLVNGYTPTPSTTTVGYTPTPSTTTVGTTFPTSTTSYVGGACGNRFPLINCTFEYCNEQCRIRAIGSDIGVCGYSDWCNCIKTNFPEFSTTPEPTTTEPSCNEDTDSESTTEVTTEINTETTTLGRTTLGAVREIKFNEFILPSCSHEVCSPVCSNSCFNSFGGWCDGAYSDICVCHISTTPSWPRETTVSSFQPEVNEVEEEEAEARSHNRNHNVKHYANQKHHENKHHQSKHHEKQAKSHNSKHHEQAKAHGLNKHHGQNKHQEHQNKRHAKTE